MSLPKPVEGFAQLERLLWQLIQAEGDVTAIQKIAREEVLRSYGEELPVGQATHGRELYDNMLEAFIKLPQAESNYSGMVNKKGWQTGEMN